MSLTARTDTLRAGQRGFTLVELAIVLVVIALLLAAILVGQELIAQARVKSAVADFSGATTMYHAYRDRYRAVPGDDPGAAARWVGATNGGGDGQVAGAYNNGGAACVASVESCNWWEHLRRGGFLHGNGPVQPANTSNGILGVQTGDGTSSGPVLGGPLGAGGLVGLLLCSSNLPEKVAAAVDVQMDDGERTTGTVRGMLQSAPNPSIAVDATAAGAGGAASYVETGTNVYAVCASIRSR